MKKNPVFFVVALFLCALFARNAGAQQSYFLSLKDGSKTYSHNLNHPSRSVDWSDNNVTVNYAFEFLSVNTKSINQVSYDLVNHLGFGSLKNVGFPSVPARTDYIAVPENADLKIEILDAAYIEFDNINLHPELEPARDTEGAPEPEFKINEKAYGTNAFYPENVASLVDVQKMRGTSLAMVQSVPVQYNPVTKKLRVYKQITYKLVSNHSFGKATLGTSSSSKSNNFVKGVVLNPEHISEGVDYNTAAKSIDNNYIIITHNEYLPAARRLANWKQQLGYGVEIVSKPAWTAAEVKSAIHTRYQNWTPKPDYFVIIGDHDGDFAVPGEIHQCPDNNDFASDLYFACMDGAGDYFPDMAHGRISASSLYEANILIDKIVNYEKYPVETASFYQNGLNCAQYQDDDDDGYADRRFCHTSENVRDYLTTEQGYTVDRIYYTNSSANISNLHYNNGYYSNGELLPEELRNASFDWDGGSSEITAAIDQGKFYILHRDHGYSGATGWSHPYYTLNSMDNLSNGDLLPVIFSINCHTGEFQLNSFAEKFMRMENKGAVGVVGAAYYSYSGYNDALVSGMFDAIWPEPGLTFDFGYGGVNNPPASGPPPAFRTMGDVVNWGLTRMVETWDGGYSSNKYQHELFHYFGDPAMKIWTSNPHDSVLAADYANDIDCAGTSFSITNCDAEGAIATICQNNKIVGKAIITSSSADIPYELVSNGEVIITISKENHKALIDTIPTTGSCIYAPLVETGNVENISYDMADLSGEIISDNGSDITASGIVVGTNINPEIGGAGVMVFQTEPLVLSGNFTIPATGLAGSTMYFFRSFATNGEGTSYGLTETFTTLCSPVSEFPYAYDFEIDLGEEDCWATEYVSGDNLNWLQAKGNSSNVNYAYHGDWNILLKDNDIEDDITKIVSPLINLAGNNYALLSFHHLQEELFGYQDELKVYYKNATNSDWTLLEEYTQSIASWEREYIMLPNLTDGYQIAFEGNAKKGKGVAIDYMQIFVSDEQADISTSTTSLNNFGAIEVGLESLPQSYTISASALLSEYIIEAPEGFVVSDTETGTYTNSLSIEHSNGSIDNTEIYVKFKPQEVTTYEDVIRNYSPNATEIQINVSGTGIPGAVQELKGINKLHVFPNPANEKITIDYSTEGTYTLQVVDLTGTIIDTFKSMDSQLEIDLSDHAAGIYFLKIIDKEETILSKFIKE